MKKIRQLKFTLMEVTVAFGIFAILVAVLMQFLNTAQRSWNFAEKRARAYADSRILFDLMDKALNTLFPEMFFPHSVLRMKMVYVFTVFCRTAINSMQIMVLMGLHRRLYQETESMYLLMLFLTKMCVK